MPSTVSLRDAISSLIERGLESIRVSIPARVERYDAALQQIDAQPLIKEAHFIEDGSRVAAQLPVICNVPVCFPGAGPYRVTFPINVGDTVLIVFSDASLDVWLSEDGLVDPLLDDKHRLSDAIAIPGLRSFKNPLADVATDALELGNDTTKIRIEDDAVRLNTVAGQLVALSNKVDDNFAELRSRFNAHTHPTAPPGVVSTPSNPIVSPLDSTASDGVYAKE